MVDEGAVVEPVDPAVRRRRMRRIAAVVVAVWVCIALVAATQVQRPDPEHAFLLTTDTGAPVSYPCGPIGLVVDSDGAPDDWQDMVDDAVTEVADASSYELVQVDRGDHSTPRVLLRWSDVGEDAELDGLVLGYGGSAVDPTDPAHYGRGGLVLDTGGQGTSDREERQATLLHELGHVLGLDHVESAYELMSTGVRRQTSTYGPGDREGLRLLHEASCGS